MPAFWARGPLCAWPSVPRPPTAPPRRSGPAPARAPQRDTARGLRPGGDTGHGFGTRPIGGVRVAHRHVRVADMRRGGPVSDGERADGDCRGDRRGGIARLGLRRGRLVPICADGACSTRTCRVGSARSSAATADAPTAERCRSGRTGRSRKPLSAQAFRGFESLPLRQLSCYLIELYLVYWGALCALLAIAGKCQRLAAKVVSPEPALFNEAPGSR